MVAPINNAWKLLDLFSNFAFACVVGSSSSLEAFVTISGFLGAYKCLQFAEGSYAKGSLKLFARKLLRITPLFYLVFFFGWAAGGFI